MCSNASLSAACSPRAKAPTHSGVLLVDLVAVRYQPTVTDLGGVAKCRDVPPPDLVYRGNYSLFDHFVGELLELPRNFKAKRLRGL
jgi:hypothetical protein